MASWFLLFKEREGKSGIMKKALSTADDRARSLYAIILKHFAAAAIVFSISASLWAAETKAVSNCEGARYIPSSSMARKYFANAFVSHFDAVGQSKTSDLLKKAQNMLPTRVE